MRGACIAVAAVLCLPWSAPAAVEEGLGVLSATVKFHGKTADLRIEADVNSPRLSARFDPAVDAFRVEFAGLPVVEIPDVSGTVRVTTNAYDDVRVRRRRALDVRLIPGSGRFLLKARGLDAAAIRAVGPGAVEVRVVIGGAETASTPRFEEHGRRKWEFRAPMRGPWGGGMGGGSGGGTDPGLPPPPPDTTPLVISLLSQGQGSRYPGDMTNSAWVVARSPAELAAMWARHAPGTQPQVVDFATEIVVGWFGGNPSAWHTVYASWAERTDTSVRVHLYLHGSLGVQGHGTHSIFRLTRSDKPIVMKGHSTIVGPGNG